MGCTSLQYKKKTSLIQYPLRTELIKQVSLALKDFPLSPSKQGRIKYSNNNIAEDTRTADGKHGKAQGRWTNTPLSDNRLKSHSPRVFLRSLLPSQQRYKY